MSYRVTNSMMRTLMLNDMHRNLNRLIDIQQQLATERKYQHASQNPHAVTKGMGLETMMSEGKQYMANLQDAVSWLKFTDEALSGMNDLFNRIRELAIKGGDGSLEEVDRMAIATELRELKAELMSISNSTIAGEYLFAGLMTNTVPFTIGPDGRVVYNGNNYAMNWEFARLQTGKVSIVGREVFPLEETTHKLKGIEVPLDFLWEGRSEILEFKVGWRTVKVRIPERWTDEIANGITDSGDYNRFRDPGEPLEGWTLDEIARLINNSTEMGDTSKLIKATVVKDVERGVQRLEITSLTGEPVRLTSWPETDPINASRGVKGAAYGPTHNTDGIRRTASSDGSVEIRFGDNSVHTLNVEKGQNLEQIAQNLNSMDVRIWAAYKSDGINEWIDIVARDPDDYFTMTTTGGAAQLFATEMTTLYSTKDGTDQVVTSKVFSDPGYHEFEMLTGGVLTIRQGFDVYTLTVPAGSGLDYFDSAAAVWNPPLPTSPPSNFSITVTVSANGSLEIRSDGDEFSVTADGGLTPLFSDGVSGSSAVNASGKHVIETKPLYDHFAFDSRDSAFAVEYGNKKYWLDLSTVLPPRTPPAVPYNLHDIAPEPSAPEPPILADFLADVTGGAVTVTVETGLDTNGDEIQWLRIESDNGPIKLSGFGNAADILGTFTVLSQPIHDNFDHTHIGFADMMQMTTSLTSTEISVQFEGWNTMVPPGEIPGEYSGAVHLNFVSGTRRGEVYIEDDPYLTLEGLAARINSVCGDWLQAVVMEDQPDGVNPITDPLNNSGDNRELATKRLVLRTIDGEPFTVYDGLGKTPDGAGAYAALLGFNTALPVENIELAYPDPAAGGFFDPNMPAILKVTVGDREFEVKVCYNNCRNGELVAKAIVNQVNEQYGGTLLSLGESVNPNFNPNDPDENPDRFSIFAVTGEPLRVVDAPYGDPRFSEFTGGIAAQLNINAGIKSVDFTAAIPYEPGGGTIRISTPGRTVDVPILEGDDLRAIANRIRDYAGVWLDVSFSTGNIPNPGSTGFLDTGAISIAAKDGSAVSIIDASGGMADALGLKTGLVSELPDGIAWGSFIFGNLEDDDDGGSPTLSIKVNGAEHTIDLWDSNAVPQQSPTVNSVEELAAMINTRFQGQDIRAEVYSDSSGEKRLAIWSPKGYNFEITGTGAYAPGGPGTEIPILEAFGFGDENDRISRLADQPFNQNVTYRTGNNTYDIDFFGVMDNLIRTVEGGDVDGLSDSILSQLDNWQSSLLKCRATAGALMNRYDAAVYRMMTNNTNYTDLYTQTVGVDLAETITDFEMASNIYQASLAAIARLLQPSLLDFLR